MEEVWGPVIGALGFTAIIVAPFIINRIIKFKLEIARINAQTTIKSEEIRAKNQLEIELLLRSEEQSRRSNYQGKQGSDFNSSEFDEERERIKRRV